MVGPFLTNSPGGPNPRLDLTALDEDSDPQRFSLSVRERMPLVGRVVDDAGNPIENAFVEANVFVGDETQIRKSMKSLGDPSARAGAIGAAIGVDGVVTDSNGRFQVNVAKGIIAIFAAHDAFRAEPQPKIVVLDDRPIADLTMTMSWNPRFRGVVRNSKQQLVPGAIVQFCYGHQVDPSAVAISDSRGAFELQPRRIRFLTEGAEPSKFFLMAFDPKSADAGVAAVDLKDRSNDAPLVIDVEPRSVDWMDNLGHLHRRPDIEFARNVRTYAEELQQRHPDGLPGNPVPSMTEGTWLNTDARGLDEFLGRFVLLDFWFIKCGPCRIEMPTTAAAHEGFPRDRFAVVSVHDNSETVESVRHFLDESGYGYATVVDDESGSIIRQFSELGLDGFPCYILVDPTGKIYQNDAILTTTVKPTLRESKLGVIRNAINQWDWTD